MKIEFVNIETGITVPEDHSSDFYFVMNNEVYRDNQESYESQESVISFDDFIEKCPELTWKVTFTNRRTTTNEPLTEY